MWREAKREAYVGTLLTDWEVQEELLGGITMAQGVDEAAGLFEKAVWAAAEKTDAMFREGGRLLVRVGGPQAGGEATV